jgi:hypothetical protein
MMPGWPLERRWKEHAGFRDRFYTSAVNELYAVLNKKEESD